MQQSSSAEERQYSFWKALQKWGVQQDKDLSSVTQSASFLKHCILAWILEDKTEKMQGKMSNKSNKKSERENLQGKKKLW